MSRLSRDRLALVVAAGVVVTCTVALGVKLGGGDLGSRHAPFFVESIPQASLWLVPALAVFAAALIAAPRLATRRVPTWAFVAAITGLTLLLQLALNTTRQGTLGWHDIFSDLGADGKGHNEYIPSLPALRLGAGTFLDLFAQIAPGLSLHASAHPPGVLLTLHLLGIETGQAMAALVIGLGVLQAPLVYALGRELLDEARGRTAALLFAFCPVPLLYGTVSADALFATLATAAVVALLARRRVWRALGPPLLALASFFSYALLGAGVWATLVAARRDGLRRAAGLAAACAATVVLFYLALYGLTGFDVVAALDAAEGAYRRSIAAQRPYWFWLFGSPAAFLVALGLPLAWLALRAAQAREPAAVALVAVLVVSALLGFTKAETERIWQFFVPLACVAAAAGLRGRLTPVLVALAAQAFAVQLLLDTVW